MPWWNDAVFYELFVRSFNDSDGDGVGDIQGVIENWITLTTAIRKRSMIPASPASAHARHRITQLPRL